MLESDSREDYELCNEHLRLALEYARQLMILADEGEAASKDDGCVLLYSVMRDCAYKIRSEANREREDHKATGRWTEGTVSQSNETH